MNLADFRQQYPAYDDMPDAVLADSLYQRFYADMPRATFDQQLGLAPAMPPPAAPASGLGGLTVADPMPVPLDPAPAVTGRASVMPSLTQELDGDPDRWSVGSAGELPFALGAPVAQANDLPPMGNDVFAGTDPWKAYPGLVVRGAAETGLGIGMGAEAMTQAPSDEASGFYDEYLTLRPMDYDQARDLIGRVRASGMTPVRKNAMSEAIADRLQDGPVRSTRELGIDAPIDTETGQRYQGARDWLRYQLPASDEQEQSLGGQVARGIGSSVGFMPFAAIPGGIWAASALAGSGEAIDRAYRAGASGQDQATATVGGLIPGAMDALTIESVLRPIARNAGALGWLRSVVMTGIRTGAIEGTTEGIQQAMQNLIAQATYDPDAAIMDGVPENVVVGGLAGMAMGAGGGMFSRRSISTPPVRTEPQGLSALTVGPDPTRVEPPPLASPFAAPEPAAPIPPTPAAPVTPGPAAVPRETEQEQTAAPVAAPAAIEALPPEPLSPLVPPQAIQPAPPAAAVAPVPPEPLAPAAPQPAAPIQPQPAPSLAPEAAPATPPEPAAPVPAPSVAAAPAPTAQPIGPGATVRATLPTGETVQGVVIEQFDEPRPERPGEARAISAPAYTLRLENGETVDVAPDRMAIEVVQPAPPEAGAPVPPPAAAAVPPETAPIFPAPPTPNVAPPRAEPVAPPPTTPVPPEPSAEARASADQARMAPRAPEVAVVPPAPAEPVGAPQEAAAVPPPVATAAAPEATPAQPEPAGNQRAAPTLRALIERAISGAVDRFRRKPSWFVIGRVDDARAEEIAAAVTRDTGRQVDVRGYTHYVDEDAVRKILNDHGSAATEAPLGQLPVTPADIEMIPEVISRGRISEGGATREGLSAVVYEAQIGDTFYYVEEVRTGRKGLAAKTMWKRRPGRSAQPSSSDVSSERSPEALPGSPPRDIALAEDGGNSTDPGARPDSRVEAPERDGRRPSRRNPRAEAAARLADYYRTGNVVPSYNGHDRVVAFDPGGPDGHWTVTVREVRRAPDGSWIDKPDARTRTHSTAPSPRELRAGPAFSAEENRRDTAERFQTTRDGAQSTERIDTQALKATLRRLAPAARLEFVDRAHLQGNEGSYLRGLIRIALDAENGMQTLGHEAIHALREMGLISPQEWARLKRRAEQEWLAKHKIARNYPNLSREAQIEEAIAEAFADHLTTPLPAIERPIWNRIKQFLDRLGAWLRGQGFQTVEDVFGRVESGEVGARRTGREAEIQIRDGLSEPLVRNDATDAPQEDVAPQPSAGNPDEKFQRPRVRGTNRQETAIDKAIEPLDPRGFGRRVIDAIANVTDRVRDEWRWALADDLDGIRRTARRAQGADRLDRELPAYVAARFARHHAGQVEAFLRYGAPEWDAAEGMLRLKPGTRGLFQIAEPIYRAGLGRLFEGYAYARRVDSQGLLASGREKNMTAAEVADALSLGQQHPEFVAAFDQIQAYKKAFVDAAEAMGLINASQRATWEKIDHIPFYRVVDGDVTAPRSGKGLANQGPGVKRLTGGDQRFVVVDPATGNVVARFDSRPEAVAEAGKRGTGFTVESAGQPIPSVIENIARNVSHLLSASMKNYAAHLAMADAIKIGIAKRVPMDMRQALVPTQQIETMLNNAGINTAGWSPPAISALWAIVPPTSKDVAAVRVNGKTEFYKVEDKLLLRALTAMHETALHPLMKGLAAIRSFFTRTITLDPTFMVRNFVRDAVAQWVQTDTRSLNFPLEMGRAMTQAVKAFRTDDRVKMLMAAGADTGWFETKPEKVARTLASLKATHGAELWSYAYDPRRYVEVLDRMGRASEMANRLATLDATRQGTGSDRQASFEAMDALDFQMRPGLAWLQGLTAITPFLNARIEGLYRLARGVATNPKRFAAAAGMLAAWSLALALYNAGDDEEGGYNDLPEYVKDGAWVIPVHRLLGEISADARKWAQENDLPRFLMIPKPFEIGMLFGTVPERLVQALAGNDRGKDTLVAVQRALMDTLAFNPANHPVAAVPLQWWANRDFFRGQPIESRSVEALPSGQRASPQTGATARLIGETTDISPAKMEMAVRGFFGTMGAYTLAAIDEAVSAATNQPPAIPRRLDQLPGLRSFIRQDPAATSKWTERFYELRKAANEAIAGAKAYDLRGETEKAAALRKEKAGEVAVDKMLDHGAEVVTRLRRVEDLARNFERLPGQAADPASGTKADPDMGRRNAMKAFAAVFGVIAKNEEGRYVPPRLANMAPRFIAAGDRGDAKLPEHGDKLDISNAIRWINAGIVRRGAMTGEKMVRDSRAQAETSRPASP